MICYETMYQQVPLNAKIPRGDSFQDSFAAHVYTIADTLSLFLIAKINDVSFKTKL